MTYFGDRCLGPFGNLSAPQNERKLKHTRNRELQPTRLPDVAGRIIYRNKKNKGLYLTRGRRKKKYDCDICKNDSNMYGFFQNYMICMFSYNSVGLGGRVSTIRIHAANYMFFFSRVVV